MTIDTKTLALKGGSPIRETRLPLNSPYLDDEDERSVSSTIRSGWIVGDGPKCKEFEEAFAEYLGVKYALLTTSCTSALHLAFLALGFSDGQAIIPDYTFTSTGLAPLLTGMTVKLCDVEFDTANIDTHLIESLITDKTRAIVPVDYAGHPCHIDKINALAKKHNLVVVHDSAQSCGSKFQGEYVGRQALVSCFSFHATKNLVTGEGGCMVTNDEELARKAYIIRDKGTNKREKLLAKGNIGYFEYQSIGNSYVQSNILGALALSQLKKLDRMNAIRRQHAEYLNEGLKHVDGIQLPIVKEYAESNWAIYAIRVMGASVIEVRDAIRAEGIECNTHYHPLHINAYYRAMAHYQENDFPVSNQVYQSLLRLPMYPQLTHTDLDETIAAVTKVMQAFHQ